MKFNSIKNIQDGGFLGFKSVKELYADISLIPKVKGVYLVLRLDKVEPSFLSVGTGGHFKGKNPNVSDTELNSNWVKETVVVYIGKAGGQTSSATLQSRLKQYLGFGHGKPVGHWGGRLIWQLKNPHDLVICWKPMQTGEPREIEAKLIKEFSDSFRRLPFANLAN